LVEAVACACPDLQEQHNSYGDFVRKKLLAVRKADVTQWRMGVLALRL